MTRQDIEILQEEADRLLALEIGILNEMLKTDGVLTASEAGEVQTFDATNTPKIIEILEGERKKLERLEMVIAIVGTMKAGKSTTINAIVGTKVLPNRNLPMTAIPTLIEHTPGQTDPMLEFKNKAPIEQLVKNLRKTLNSKDKKTTVEELGQDRDMKELIDFIRSQTGYESSYVGADKIFNFLKGLNDLVRLSKELGLEFPFSDYDEIHEIPVIKVEFVHLRETEQAHGKLTLLDTPGPNESGQPHLRKMLKDQLAKASAVLAVLDFTQLKSDADAQVREDLKAIASVSEGRLYTLVNKFDNKNENSDNAEQVKSFVANTLMERSIPESHVFPVSAENGYLANRVRHELFMNKELPDHKTHPWVADFGRKALGTRWETNISNIEGTKEAADGLWEESLFHDPLEQIIKTAQAQAALLVIETAAAKLVDTSAKLENFLNARETALTKSTDDLHQETTALLHDIARIKTAEATAGKNAKDTLDKLEKEIKKRLSSIKKKLESEIKKRLEDPKFSISEFDDAKEARDLLEEINNTVGASIEQAEKEMKKSMTEDVAKFQTDFSTDVEAKMKEIIADLAKRLEKGGFQISLTLPNIEMLSLDASGSDMLTDLIEEKQKTVPGQRRQTGVWGTICRWFSSDDWGWESYQKKVKCYHVDMEKITESVHDNIEKMFKGLDASVTEKIRTPLQNSIKEFFGEFKNSVDQIRGDLLAGLRSKEGSKVEQKALAAHLLGLRKNMLSIRGDSTALYSDIRKSIKTNTGKEK